MTTIVYKVGGSLLDLPDLAGRLRAILAQPFPPIRGGTFQRLVIVGGGAIADIVRRYDGIHRLDSAACHHLALQAMSLNAHLLHRLLPEARFVSGRTNPASSRETDVAIIGSPAEILDACERETAESLPRSWDVTSDSIAAFLAIHWQADGLVLIKSVPCPAEGSARVPSDREAVDPHFAALASRLKHLGWVNLRTARPTIETWRPGD